MRTQNRSSHPAPLIALLGCAMLTSLGLELPGRGGQGDPRGQGRQGPPQPRSYVFGAQFCADCHGNPERYRDRQDEMICVMDEYKTWHENDGHEYAFYWPMNVPPTEEKAKDRRQQNGERFLMLAGQRAKKIASRLGVVDVVKSQACIPCHAVPVAGNVPTQYFVQRTEGVSCVACHGAAQDWVLRHQAVNDPEWRVLTREQKEQRYGMVDLWNPVTRATKCLSCHVGNADEQKVITHAMYAAGHPPLPSIEVAAFSDEQPRHWKYQKEKLPRIQVLLGFNPNRLEQTELVAVSGIVTLRESMRMFAAQARSGAPAGGGWPDFARFDCSSCHHELITAGPLAWRRTRGSSGAPGRPTVPNWPSVLVRIGIEAANPKLALQRTQQLEDDLQEFQLAMRAKPFGDCRRALRAADRIIDQSQAIIRDLTDMTRVPPGTPARIVDRSVALGLLHTLCAIVSGETLDYDSARQITWAFRTIYQEVVPQAPRAVQDTFEALDSELSLTLHRSPSHAPKQPNGIAQKPPIIETLAGRLRSIAAYDPESLQRHFANLKQSLPGKRLVP